MTKREVLEVLRDLGPTRPDDVIRRLRGYHRRSSVYSYLFRLHRQGLLGRTHIYGHVHYQISQRGVKRLNFLRSQGAR